MDSILEDVLQAVQNGRPVDVRRVSILQSLEIARVGRQFLEDQQARQNEADNIIQKGQK